MDELTHLVIKSLKFEIKDALDTVLNQGRAADTDTQTPIGFALTGDEQFPMLTNVRVIPSEVPFTTVGSLVQDMLTRRDVSEHLETASVLDLEATLVKAEIAIAEEKLRGAVARLLA